MTISVGAQLPDVTLAKMGANGPEAVSLRDLAKGRKIVLFAVPGAFTPTCHSAHVPSFIRTKAQFDAKGVDEIICVAVNDVFVMKAWGEATGATAAGITMLSDGGSALAKAFDITFDGPAAGLYGRSKRYALYAEDGVIKVVHAEENSGQCEISGGEAMLAAI